MRQRIVVVAGPPAGGKTSIMLHAIGALQAKGQQVAVVKIDCLDTEDHHRYAKLNIPVVVGLSRDVCPDHFFAVNFEEMAEWARERMARPVNHRNRWLVPPLRSRNGQNAEYLCD